MLVSFVAAVADFIFGCHADMLCAIFAAMLMMLRHYADDDAMLTPCRYAA